MDQYKKIDIKCPSGYDEIISSILNDEGIEYIEIIDYKDVLDFKKDKPYWVVIDDNDFSYSKDVILKAYYDLDKDINLSKIKDKLDNLSKENNIIIEISQPETIENHDWANEWKKYYRPVEIKDIVIRPSWLDYENPDKMIVDINPGLAFGTGLHETTSLCIDHLQDIDLKGKKVLDIGCGSGILSIVSSKLGASKVLGSDIDPLAVEATRANASLNKVENIEVIESSLLDKINGKYDIVIANILLNVLEKLIVDLDKVLDKDGLFISSGLLVTQRARIENFLIDKGFELIDVVEKGEWISVISRKKDNV